MLLFLRVNAIIVLLSIIPWKRVYRPRFKLFKDRSISTIELDSRMIFAKTLAEEAPKPCSFRTSLFVSWSFISWQNLANWSSIFFESYKSFCRATKSFRYCYGTPSLPPFLTTSSSRVLLIAPDWLMIAGWLKDASEIDLAMCSAVW